MMDDSKLTNRDTATGKNPIVRSPTRYSGDAINKTDNHLAFLQHVDIFLVFVFHFQKYFLYSISYRKLDRSTVRPSSAVAEPAN